MSILRHRLPSLLTATAYTQRVQAISSLASSHSVAPLAQKKPTTDNPGSTGAGSSIGSETSDQAPATAPATAPAPASTKLDLEKMKGMTGKQRSEYAAEQAQLSLDEGMRRLAKASGKERRRILAELALEQEAAQQLQKDATADAQKVATEIAHRSTEGVRVEELIARVTQGLQSGMRPSESLVGACLAAFSQPAEAGQMTDFLESIYSYGTKLSPENTAAVVQAFLRVGAEAQLLSIIERREVYGVFPEMASYELMVEHLLRGSESLRENTSAEADERAQSVFRLFHLAVASYRPLSPNLIHLVVTAALALPSEGPDMDAALDTYFFAKRVGLTPEAATARDIALTLLKQGDEKSLGAFLTAASLPSTPTPSAPAILKTLVDNFEIVIPKAFLQSRIPKAGRGGLPKTPLNKTLLKRTDNERSEASSLEEQQSQAAAVKELMQQSEAFKDEQGKVRYDPWLVRKAKAVDGNLVLRTDDFLFVDDAPFNFVKKEQARIASRATNTPLAPLLLSSVDWAKSPSGRLLLKLAQSSDPKEVLKSARVTVAAKSGADGLILREVFQHLHEKKGVSVAELKASVQVGQDVPSEVRELLEGLSAK